MPRVSGGGKRKKAQRHFHSERESRLGTNGAWRLDKGEKKGQTTHLQLHGRSNSRGQSRRKDEEEGSSLLSLKDEHSSILVSQSREKRQGEKARLFF